MSLAIDHLDTSPRSSDAPLLRSRKVAFASLIGTMIEWYDFFIFGTAAALIFNGLVHVYRPSVRAGGGGYAPDPIVPFGSSLLPYKGSALDAGIGSSLLTIEAH